MSQPTGDHGRMPDPPSSWCAAYFARVRASNSQEIATGGGNGVRGPTFMHNSFWNKQGQPKICLLLNSENQPIMEERSQLMSAFGVIARDGNLLPLNYVDWRWVPHHKKERVWKEIEARVENAETIKVWLMQSLGKKWSNWKSYLRTKYYVPYNNDEARLANYPQTRVVADQWKCLVYHWGQTKVQDKCQKNKDYRSKQVRMHTMGRSCYAVLAEKMKVNGIKPKQTDVWIRAHIKTDGTPSGDNNAAAIERFRQLGVPQGGSSSPTMDEADKFKEVLGKERHGRVRGYGLGVTPSQLAKGRGGNSQKAASSKDTEQLMNEVAFMSKTIFKMSRALLSLGVDVTKIPDDDEEEEPLGSPTDSYHPQFDEEPSHRYEQSSQHENQGLGGDGNFSEFF